MFNTDNTFTLILIFQPFFLGVLFYNLCLSYFIGFVVLTFRNLSVRQHLSGIRFFECSAFPRHHGAFSYQSQITTLIAAFLIYDLDLIFFFSETLMFDFWMLDQCFFFFFWLAFFIFGLYYDSWRLGLYWGV